MTQPPESGRGPCHSRDPISCSVVSPQSGKWAPAAPSKHGISLHHPSLEVEGDMRDSMGDSPEPARGSQPHTGGQPPPSPITAGILVGTFLRLSPSGAGFFLSVK